MTDEEKAKEWVRTNSGYSTKEFHGKKAIKAFLAGIKAGGERYKLKWHKIADGDLPKDTRYVWTNVGPSYYDDDKDCPCWRDEFGRTQGVIAWCEPKFEE